MQEVESDAYVPGVALEENDGGQVLGVLLLGEVPALEGDSVWGGDNEGFEGDLEIGGRLESGDVILGTEGEVGENGHVDEFILIPVESEEEEKNYGHSVEETVFEQVEHDIIKEDILWVRVLINQYLRIYIQW